MRQVEAVRQDQEDARGSSPSSRPQEVPEREAVPVLGVVHAHHDRCGLRQEVQRLAEVLDAGVRVSLGDVRVRDRRGELARQLAEEAERPGFALTQTNSVQDDGSLLSGVLGEGLEQFALAAPHAALDDDHPVPAGPGLGKGGLQIGEFLVAVYQDHLG